MKGFFSMLIIGLFKLMGISKLLVSPILACSLVVRIMSIVLYGDFTVSLESSGITNSVEAIDSYESMLLFR